MQAFLYARILIRTCPKSLVGDIQESWFKIF
ncbi:Uncharacterised protein [Vibrio cholerae]|nr:Uncharacterised protein [Vibrio cholerae]